MLVIHGGYSRTVVFLKYSDNNRASSLFTSAVDLHGLPNRLRTDLSSENVAIWRYNMVEQHASVSTVLTGSMRMFMARCISLCGCAVP